MSKSVNSDHAAIRGTMPESGNPATEDYLVSKKYAWYVFALLSALMFFDFLDRQIIASLFPFLKQEWGLTDAQCGMLMAAVNWSITVFAIPVAILADRWSRTKTIGLMATLWSLATVACAFTKNFSQLLMMRLTIGVGEAGYSSAGQAMLSVLFPARLRATVIGVFATGFAVLGGAVGIVLGGWIGTHYGWRMALGVVGLPGLIFSLLFFTLRDYKTVKLTIKTSEDKTSSQSRKMTKKEIIKSILGKPSIVFLILGQTVGVFFGSLLGAWLPSFFIRVHNLSVMAASQKAGMVFVVCIFGTFLGGYMADRAVARGITSGRPLVAGICQLIAFVIFFSAFGFAEGQTQFILLLLGGFWFQAFQGAVFSGILELVNPGLRATAVSFLIFFQNLAGMALGPVVAGALSDKYGIATALTMMSTLPALSMVLFFVCIFFYKYDLARVEQVKVSM